MLNGSNSNPLTLIISQRLLSLIEIVFMLNLTNNRLIKTCIRLIDLFDTWLVFDRILTIKPEAIELIDPENITLSSIIRENAIITFRMLLQKDKITYDNAAQIVSTAGSVEFRDILKDYDYSRKKRY